MLCFGHVVALIVGGQDINSQRVALNNKPHIIVGKLLQLSLLAQFRKHVICFNAPVLFVTLFLD